MVCRGGRGSTCSGSHKSCLVFLVCSVTSDTHIFRPVIGAHGGVLALSKSAAHVARFSRKLVPYRHVVRILVVLQRQTFAVRLSGHHPRVGLRSALWRGDRAYLGRHFSGGVGSHVAVSDWNLTAPSSGSPQGRSALFRSPLMSNVRLLFLATATRRIAVERRLTPAAPRGGAVAIPAFARSRRSSAPPSLAAVCIAIRPRKQIRSRAPANRVPNWAPCTLPISAKRRVGNNLTRRSSGRACGTPLS